MKGLSFIALFFLSANVHGSPLPNLSSQGNEPSVTTLQSATVRVAPSGKARITILAQGKNAFLGKLWLAPNAQVPIHRDPTEEYLHIVEGRGQLTMNGKTYPVQAGTTVFMPAKAEVTFKNGPEALVCLQVFSSPDSAKKYLKWPKAKTPKVSGSAK